MGTISDKLTYLNGTKQAIKDELNKFGAGLDNEDTFRSYSNVLNDIYDKLPKVSANGSNFRLENAQNGKLDSFGMDGNTEQTTYTGKNLLNPYEYNTPTEKNGITCTYDAKDQSYTFNGTCTADNTSFEIGAKKISFTNGITTVSAYLISGSVSNYCVFRTFDVNFGRNTPIDLTNLSSNNPIIYATCNGTNYTATYISLRFQEGSIANNLKVKFMIADSTDTTYEPYVGGTPSPNPDYPQDIRVVENEQIVNVHRKNLLNTTLERPVGYSTTINGITFTINEDKTITVNGTVTGTDNARFTFIENGTILGTNKKITSQLISGTISGQCTFFAYDSTYDNAKTSQVATDGSVNNTTLTTNVEYAKFRLTVYAGATVNNAKIGLMVLDSLDDTTYEPYQSQDYGIDLGDIELCKIGDYKDYIYKTSGKNLFDKNNANVLNAYIAGSSATITASENNKCIYIPCKPNTTYTVSKNFDTTQNRFRIGFTNVIPAIGDICNPYSGTQDSVSSYTITSGAESKYLVLYYYTNSGTLTEQQILDSIQIEQGSTATDYEPYGTDWYVKKEIGKVVLDGSESWILNSDNIPFYNLTNSYNGAINLVIPNGYSNYFTLTTGVITSSNSFIGISASSSGKYFRVRLETMLSLNDFKTWLSTHNTEVYYILATPTYEKITNETLISQLESIETFTGLNYFSVSNENNVLPTLYVSRLKELGKLE